jgi:uncharacterized protein (DUF433 family)
MSISAIIIDLEMMGGMPVFAGTRVPIQSLWDYLETGETLDEFLENFPKICRPNCDFALAARRRPARLPAHGPRFSGTRCVCGIAASRRWASRCSRSCPRPGIMQNDALPSSSVTGTGLMVSLKASDTGPIS